MTKIKQKAKKPIKKVVAKKRPISKKVRQHAKKTLVPHKDNNFTPHIMRWYGLSVVLVLALLMQVGYGYLTAGKLEVLGRVSNVTVSGLLDDTNKAREDAGLGTLKISEDLSQAAFLKAKDMFANNYWAHTSPNGTTPWKWLGDVGYNYNVAGENLAKNYPNAQSTVGAWMESATHRANILDERYKDIGFAVVDGILNGRDTTLVVAYYGAPASGAVAGTSNQPSVYAAPVSGGVGNPLTYFGSALQSLSPATLGGLALLTLLTLAGALAHHYRKRLPAALRKTWKAHHGMFTIVGAISLGLILILATGGGQI